MRIKAYVFYFLAIICLWFSYSSHNKSRGFAVFNEFAPAVDKGIYRSLEMQSEMKAVGGLLAAALCGFIGRKSSSQYASQIKKCPSCKETIQSAAVKCKHCGSEV
jgi:amino acid transporter